MCGVVGGMDNRLVPTAGLDTSEVLLLEGLGFKSGRVFFCAPWCALISVSYSLVMSSRVPVMSASLFEESRGLYLAGRCGLVQLFHPLVL